MVGVSAKSARAIVTSRSELKSISADRRPSGRTAAPGGVQRPYPGDVARRTRHVAWRRSARSPAPTEAVAAAQRGARRPFGRAAVSTGAAIGAISDVIGAIQLGVGTVRAFEKAPAAAAGVRRWRARNPYRAIRSAVRSATASSSLHLPLTPSPNWAEPRQAGSRARQRLPSSCYHRLDAGQPALSAAHRLQWLRCEEQVKVKCKDPPTVAVARPHP